MRSVRLAWLVVALTLIAACDNTPGRTDRASLPPLASLPATTSSVAVTSTSSTTTSTTSTTSPPTTTTTITTVATTAAPATTIDPSQPPTIEAGAYAVYDVGSQQWLADLEADAARPVGSLMKLLTAYVVMQAGDPAHVATVPAMQLDPAESAIGLYEGQRLSRAVLLRAELIVSANDAAHTLALDVAGTEEAFVGMMNDAAQTLAMTQTVAVNAVGLDADGAHSSARDMVSIAAILMQDPTFQATVARTEAQMNGQHFNATNKMLTRYEGATGVKTGHTTNAGYCLVGSATRGDRSVIVAVLGAPSDQARIDGASALLDWAFDHPV